MLTGTWVEVLNRAGFNFEYTYTDISSSFFSDAEKRFEKVKNNFRFKKLDIEQDPVGQGFVPEYYDYCIAFEVIHATKNVMQSLHNLRILLKPHGSLDIFEQTKVNRVASYLFGPLDGFWRFEDFDLRPDHCTMSLGQWRVAFESSGFEITGEFPCFNDHHSIICTQKGEFETNKKKQESASWIVFTEDSPLSNALVQKLRSAGREVKVLKRPAQSNDSLSNIVIQNGNLKDVLKGLLSGASCDVEGVLYCWALDHKHQTQSELLQPYLYIAQTLSLLKQKEPPRMIALTTGCIQLGDNGHRTTTKFHASTLWGFTKSLKNEHLGLKCHCIDVDEKLINCDDGAQAVFYELWNDDLLKPQVALVFDSTSRMLTRYVPKLKPHKPLNQLRLMLPGGTHRFCLEHPKSRSIADLKFVHMEEVPVVGAKIEVEIKASALNFRDVLGVLKPSEEFKDLTAIGIDFAGVVNRVGPLVKKWKVGDCVFGMHLGDIEGPDSLPSHIVRHEEDVERVPDKMTLSEAATLPVVFTTAYYSLIEVVDLQRSDTVLLHTATGGVGLCAIQICQHVGAKIIATAGTKLKRHYLRRNFGIQHVFNSRTTTFDKEVLEVTNGKGVTVVLNSLTGEGYKEATLMACAEGARFVEMSKMSIWSTDEVKQRRPDVKYTIVDLSVMPSEPKRKLAKKMVEYVLKRIVKPPPYIRFDGNCIRDALTYLQQAKHIGKIVCVMPEIQNMKTVTPMFNQRSTYLITGGLGGIGFEVAKWMLSNGAKYIILVGRSTARPSIQEEINLINSNGAHSLIQVQIDIGNREKLEEFLEETLPQQKLPPLRGVMHAAGCLSDGMIVNQTWNKFITTFKAKVDGTLNLHELTLRYPLEHFVLFSSFAALMGPPGQSNHAAGNCFEDAVAHYRHFLGYPATTINWGAWAEVGVATAVNVPGTKSLSTSQGIAALEYAMKSHRAQLCAITIHSVDMFIKAFPQATAYLEQKVKDAEGIITKKNDRILNLNEQFWNEYDAEGMTLEKKRDLLKSTLRTVVKQILYLDQNEQISDTMDFQQLGLDSLMFVEMQNSLQTLFGQRLRISTASVREYSNITNLSSHLLNSLETFEACNVEGVCHEVIKPPSYEMVKKLIRADSKLPQHIVPCNDQPPPVGIDNIKIVLLTGGNGTLGPYVLKELSARSQITKIYCLVRSRGKESARTRLLKRLKNTGLYSCVDLTKIECLDGDLALSKLGLCLQLYDQLVTEVDAIFHCAAKIDYTEYYRESSSTSDGRAVNIGGTKNILKLAATGRTKHVFHASSIICLSKTDPEDGRACEEWPEVGDFDDITIFSYSITKFVSDLLVKQAVDRGIPCKSFRFPIITGDSKTGRFNLDKNFFMIRYFYIMQTGTMPSLPFPMACLPVDLAAEVSVDLFFNTNAQLSDIYNLVHHHAESDTEFKKLAKKFGYDIKTVDFSEFVNNINNEADDSPIGLFKEFFKDEQVYKKHLFAFIGSWKEGMYDYWMSKKLNKMLPEFYSKLKRPSEYLEQDLLFAKSQGWLDVIDV